MRLQEDKQPTEPCEDVSLVVSDEVVAAVHRPEDLRERIDGYGGLAQSKQCVKARCNSSQQHAENPCSNSIDWDVLVILYSSSTMIKKRG